MAIKLGVFSVFLLAQHSASGRGLFAAMDNFKLLALIFTPYNSETLVYL